MSAELLDQSPEQFIARLREAGGRACLTWDHEEARVRTSHPWLADIATWLAGDARDFHAHEGVFMAVGPETGALMTATVHTSVRGQAAGGLRHWPYATIQELLRDGLRLSLGMSRKNALAGLWWGGGKGIIARQSAERSRDPGYRRTLYREYGAFTTSLRGVYITAEDVGTQPDDLAAVFETTRFATCVPPSVGGSGNPSPATAKGVVCAIEAALDHCGRGSIAGKTIAMQGAGNVATYMIEELLARGVGRVIAAEISAERCELLRARFVNAPVELRHAEIGDLSIFAEPCDVLAPNALGGVLGPATIPMIQAPIVCGAANNQLLDDRRDDRDLAARGIVYVPDFVANRMGIVNCANEQYGQIGGPDKDPAIERHFSRDWDNAVFVVTKRILEHAQTSGITTSAAANELADKACRLPHPIWGHRGRAIVDGLLADDWAR
ncbi:Glu/Leu/Phe/Val dehydrogenase dimerization domain-containing protein [Enhygromyxa salina]|uniref:Leucine dehydrogenase n=1 Tax=Enhygromyxa salina TaxID=215803 RepID=A0A2S9YFX5_9BACT|nr:Glu/Leu/Phe/Val dehydrogenase dimerization domain-containing protein [Enhygromyxa salina]PRQ04014.1 Leucine dehydrogenase [Enhygromyxa salina]